MQQAIQLLSRGGTGRSGVSSAKLAMQQASWPHGTTCEHVLLLLLEVQFRCCRVLDEDQGVTGEHLVVDKDMRLYLVLELQVLQLVTWSRRLMLRVKWSWQLGPCALRIALKRKRALQKM